MKPVRSIGLHQNPSQDPHRYQAEQNAKVLDGNVSFGNMQTNLAPAPGNMKGNWVRTTSTGGVQTLYHGLGYIPVGFLVVSKSAACDFFSVTPWDANNIKIQATVAGVDFTLFVLG